MSKLQELIKQYCPNGVEYKKLGEVCDVLNGYAFKSNKYVNEGYRVIRIGDVQSGCFDNSDIRYYPKEEIEVYEKYKLNEYDIVVSLTGNCGRVAMVRKTIMPCALNQRVAALRSKGIINQSFLFYLINSKQFESRAMENAFGAGQKNLSTRWLSNLEIPVPPLEVQEEIVKILDRFSEYAAELQAELQARREQYEYYRDKLLSFNKIGGVLWLTMNEIFEIKNGYTPSKSVKEYWENGTIPWFRMEDIRKSGRVLSDAIQHITPQAVKGGKLFSANSFILATTATIGEHALLLVNSLANQRFSNLKVREQLSERLNTKYLYYYFFIIDEWCKNNTNVSGFASVDMAKLKKLLIPIPPLAEQERIVGILDKFETLVNDLSEGLPSEIAAVGEQYEYYRNKLLTFPRA